MTTRKARSRHRLPLGQRAGREDHKGLLSVHHNLDFVGGVEAEGIFIEKREVSLKFTRCKEQPREQGSIFIGRHFTVPCLNRIPIKFNYRVVSHRFKSQMILTA